MFKYKFYESFMILHPISQNSNSISFQAGKSILYTDFDDTFLPQPLDGLYGNCAGRVSTVMDVNDYFAQIQNFVDEKKGKFGIVITTGRRFGDIRRKGFEPFYKEMLAAGIKFPKVEKLITSNGGDVFSFRADGSLNPRPDAAKAELVKTLTGWDIDKVKELIKNAGEAVGVGYKFVNPKGNYDLSIKLDDVSKNSDFFNYLNRKMPKNMRYELKIKDIKDYDGEGFYKESLGIRLAPTIDGKKLHKGIDTFAAVQSAIKNNDFVIVAGDSTNDKKMLNIFRYVDVGQSWYPEDAGEVTDILVERTRKQIDDLPLKILFVKRVTDNPNLLVLQGLMEKIAEVFPNKVRILNPTRYGQRNYYLEAVEGAVNEYEAKLKVVKGKAHWGKWVAFGAAACAAGGLLIKKMFFDEKQVALQALPVQNKAYSFFA